MKITLCGSMVFYDQMVAVREELKSLGFEALLPNTEVVDDKGEKLSVEEYYAIRKTADATNSWVWERKAESIRDHFNKVVEGGAVLILNYEKNGVPGYIGANTFLEMGLAFYLGKPIYLLNGVPEVGNKEELLGMQPIILEGDLKGIKTESRV